MEIDAISKLFIKRVSRRRFVGAGMGALLASAGIGCGQEQEQPETNPLVIPESLEVFLSEEENRNRILDASQLFARANVDQLLTFPQIYIVKLHPELQEQFGIKTINFSMDNQGDGIMVILEWAKEQPLGKEFQKPRTLWPAYIIGHNQNSKAILKSAKNYQTLGGEKNTPHRYLALTFPLLDDQEQDMEWTLLLNKGLLSGYSGSVIYPLRFRLVPPNNQI